MLAVGVLAAAAALILGLRFSVVTLVLLTLATVEKRTLTGLC